MNPKMLLAVGGPEPTTPEPIALPKIYYINLDSRPDRNTEFVAEMCKLSQFVPKMPEIVRVSAIKNDVGAIGCGMSHCKALEMFLATADETAIIMEDDFTMCDKMIPVFKEYLERGTIPGGGDCFLLAANLRAHTFHSKEFIRVHRSFTTSGYWLNRQTAQDLLRLWECNTLLHVCSLLKPTPKYCIDVAWWDIMRDRRFIAMSPLIGQIGYQRPGFSDIERKIVNYGV